MYSSMQLIFILSVAAFLSCNLPSVNTPTPVAVVPVVDSILIPKFSKMMDETQYWAIVDAAAKQNLNEAAHETYLINELKKLSLEEIAGFRMRTDKLLYDTYTTEMWAVADLLNGGSSDDGFEYFRLWLISRGKNVYYAAVKNPDSLINEVQEDGYIYEFEMFWYVALEAFEQKTGKELYDHIDYDKFTTHEGKYSAIDTEKMSEAYLKKTCPKLYAKFVN